MFVIRKPFRNYNQMMLPGTIVEPGSIKWFKNRFKDRYIVEVNEQNFDKWEKYFVGKYGVSLNVEEPITEEAIGPSADVVAGNDATVGGAEIVKPKVVVAAVAK